MKDFEVYSVERRAKSRRCETLVIGFLDDDYARVSLPQTDALVVTLAIANHKIYQILLDNGSSADILYQSAFKHMKIDQEKISPARYPLLSFLGEQVLPVDSIELPVTARTFLSQ
jgi:hypothetical protein